MNGTLIANEIGMALEMIAIYGLFSKPPRLERIQDFKWRRMDITNEYDDIRTQLNDSIYKINRENDKNYEKSKKYLLLAILGMTMQLTSIFLLKSSPASIVPASGKANSEKTDCSHPK